MKTSHTNPWTPEEEALARACMTKRVPMKDYMRVVGRSYHACRHHLRWVDDAGWRAERSNANRRALKIELPIKDRERPPPRESAIEAEYRKTAPRSLVAWIVGDPPPGYSALDRRQPAEAGA